MAQKQLPDTIKWIDVGQRSPNINDPANYINKHPRCKNLRKNGVKYRIVLREINESVLAITPEETIM